MGTTPDNQIPNLARYGKVREIRERLREEALAAVELYMQTVREAADAGKYEEALKSLQWLMEHMPADPETGERPIDSSVDKQPKGDGRKGGPKIQIGLAIGLPKKELPQAQVIDVEAEEDDDVDS